MVRGFLIVLVALGTAMLPISSGSDQAHAATMAAICPFCSATGQTLRQEMESMDVVAIATLVDDAREEIDGSGNFRIDTILKGDNLVKVGDQFAATYFGPGKSDKKFLLQGVDPRELVWSSPVPLGEDAEAYVRKLVTLPEDPSERIAFFQEYLEHPDNLLSRDCYDEFALTPYDELIKFKPRLKYAQLVTWARDPAMAPDRKRLYFTLLGLCGTAEDTVWMEEMLSSTKPEDRTGLDSLIAAYLNLKGEAGLPIIVNDFLKNPDSQYVDIFSAVMALRFHSTEGKVLKKEDVAAAMCTLLDRPDLADLVIPDLARMEDWSQLDRLTQLFKDATEENAWIRMPIVNYARACPLPEAKDRLKEMEEIDPAAVKRSKTFFPIPIPSAAPKDQSFQVRRKPNSKLAEAGNRTKSDFIFRHDANSLRETRIASLPTARPLAGNTSDLNGQERPMNQLGAFAVICLATLTATTFMWLVATRNG